MALAAQLKQTLVKEFQRHEGDTGSPEVQVAILTNRMRELSEHLKAQKHDFASRRGLVLMVVLWLVCVGAVVVLRRPRP